MSKHTPGKWVHYDDSRQSVHRHLIAAMGKTIAHIYCTAGDEAADEANARLIAAAPEMLEALERARHLVRLVTVGMVIKDDDAIEAAGINPWVINEGLADKDDAISAWWLDAVIAKARGS